VIPASLLRVDVGGAQAMGTLATHVAGIATEVCMLAAACNQRASHDLAFKADTALEAAQHELSPALDLLLAMYEHPNI